MLEEHELSENWVSASGTLFKNIYSNISLVKNQTPQTKTYVVQMIG
jgi:hypothetical protein